MKIITVTLKEENGNWLAEARDLEGVHTYGNSIEQAKDRIVEAISTVIEGESFEVEYVTEE